VLVSDKERFFFIQASGGRSRDRGVELVFQEGSAFISLGRSAAEKFKKSCKRSQVPGFGVPKSFRFPEENKMRARLEQRDHSARLAQAASVMNITRFWIRIILFLKASRLPPQDQSCDLTESE